MRGGGGEEMYCEKCGEDPITMTECCICEAQVCEGCLGEHWRTACLDVELYLVQPPAAGEEGKA